MGLIALRSRYCYACALAAEYLPPEVQSHQGRGSRRLMRATLYSTDSHQLKLPLALPPVWVWFLGLKSYNSIGLGLECSMRVSTSPS